MMPAPTEEQIRVRAYEIWVAEGQPHGRDYDHWLMAVADLSRPAAPKPKKAPAAKTDAVAAAERIEKKTKPAGKSAAKSGSAKPAKAKPATAKPATAKADTAKAEVAKAEAPKPAKAKPAAVKPAKAAAAPKAEEAPPATAAAPKPATKSPA